MVLVPVTCPYCHSDQIIKGGHTETGKQRYRCQQTTCAHRSFVLEPTSNGRLPQVKVSDHGVNPLKINGLIS
jgi:transposase-like protein